jgi:large subunit ribosomal protein L25
MDKVILEVKRRQTKTKSDLTQLRKGGRVPGIFYSKHHEPVAIDVEANSLNPLVFTSKAHLISLKVDSEETFDCVLKDVQFDPVTDKVIHFDLMGLEVGEKAHIEVPVQLVGTAVGIKEGGVLQHILHKIEIECLPSDIPEHIEVDISNLKKGQSIHIGDLNIPNVVLKQSADSIIVSITHQRAEKSVASVAELGEEIKEPEVISRGKVQEEED